MRLIANGAGWCYKPDCKTGSLWYVVDDRTTVKLAEVAHIVAASVDGPRGSSDTLEPELVSIENLVLLCPTCHLVIDRAPNNFTVDVIKQWKSGHEAKIRSVLEIQKFNTRKGLNKEVAKVLNYNRLIWLQYGPESGHEDKLITDVSDAWRRKVVTDIIPNTIRLVKLIDLNRDLLAAKEYSAIEMLRLHVSAMQDRHLGGVVNPAAPRFPAGLDEMFRILPDDEE